MNIAVKFGKRRSFQDAFIELQKACLPFRTDKKNTEISLSVRSIYFKNLLIILIVSS